MYLFSKSIKNFQIKKCLKSQTQFFLSQNYHSKYCIKKRLYLFKFYKNLCKLIKTDMNFYGNIFEVIIVKRYIKATITSINSKIRRFFLKNKFSLSPT